MICRRGTSGEVRLEILRLLSLGDPVKTTCLLLQNARCGPPRRDNWEKSLGEQQNCGKLPRNECVCVCVYTIVFICTQNMEESLFFGKKAIHRLPRPLKDLSFSYTLNLQVDMYVNMLRVYPVASRLTMYDVHTHIHVCFNAKIDRLQRYYRPRGRVLRPFWREEIGSLNQDSWICRFDLIQELYLFIRTN